MSIQGVETRRFGTTSSSGEDASEPLRWLASTPTAMRGHSARCAPFASARSFGDGCALGGSVAPRRSDEERIQSPVKRRLLVRRGATDPLEHRGGCRFVKKRRDAPRIELACGDFGLRPRGICFPQSFSRGGCAAHNIYVSTRAHAREDFWYNIPL